MEKPTTEHLSVVKHLLRYIAGTKNYGCVLRHGGEKLELVGYSDADMAGDLDDWNSMRAASFSSMVV
jgi:hypothetical protein